MIEFYSKCHLKNFYSFLHVTVVLAINVPYLALFISLFGALCLSVLGIAFPAVMEICVLYPDQLGFCYNVILRNLVLIFIGLFALITGTHKSVFDIITEMRNATSSVNATALLLQTNPYCLLNHTDAQV